MSVEIIPWGLEPVKPAALGQSHFDARDGNRTWRACRRASTCVDAEDRLLLLRPRRWTLGTQCPPGSGFNRLLAKMRLPYVGTQLSKQAKCNIIMTLLKKPKISTQRRRDAKKIKSQLKICSVKGLNFQNYQRLY